MTKENHLLTFELSPDGQELDIHLDSAGIEDMLLYLRRLKDAREPLPRHTHLMTPAWAGNELSEEPQNPQATLLNMVTIRLWP